MESRTQAIEAAVNAAARWTSALGDLEEAFYEAQNLDTDDPHSTPALLLASGRLRAAAQCMWEAIAYGLCEPLE